jgi:hypothetical protein
MPDRVREVIEGLLPWYDPDRERARDARSERIHRFSIAARKSAEAVMRRDVEADALAAHVHRTNHALRR